MPSSVPAVTKLPEPFLACCANKVSSRMSSPNVVFSPLRRARLIPSRPTSVTMPPSPRSVRPPRELCKVCGVDRGVDDATERPIRLVYAARHLKRPLPSHAAQQRCTDKQSVAALPLMNIEPLTITKKGGFEWSAAENQGSVLIDDTDVS